MKANYSIFATLLAMSCIGCSQTPKEVASFDVIPAPLEVSLAPTEANFVYSAATTVVYAGDDADMQRNAQFLGEYLKLTKTATDETLNNSIVLKLGLESVNPEAYRLEVNSNQIVIQGASPAGVFYGIQTLRKSIDPALKAECIPAGVINDEPRFGYRGAHLDPCRHFFTIEETKQYIDMMALHNMNRFHWHLSEDQGWRIEIKKYPKLIKEGAYRPNTAIGHVTEDNLTAETPFDTIPVSGYYTQEEAREIVKYAADRYITVIPEIDLPGHMVAALTAYPEFGCTGGPYEVWRWWGVSKDVLCVSKPETMQFLDDVLDEICQIFPSEYIHVGGDEAPKVRWKECPRCQALIKKLGYKDDKVSSKEEKLQSGYVTQHVEDFLAARGRKIIGWDEILEGGNVSQSATVMSWRGAKGGIAAAQRGNDAIMSPSSHLYFDYYQVPFEDRQYEPDAIGGVLLLETSYNYEPIPADFTAEQASHIIGVQGNCWTEYIPNFQQVQYMTLPRFGALSEVQWSAKEKKDWNSFFYRLPKLYQVYDALGYNYARHAYGVNAGYTWNDADSTVQVKLYNVDNAPIYYTLDGSEPTVQSTRYEAPFDAPQGANLKAIVIRENGANSNPIDRTLTPQKVNARPW